MTGREKILAAFEPEGSPEPGVVTCYDTIFLRDHWRELTAVPWWYAWSGCMDDEEAWIGDFLDRSGLDWLTVKSCPARAQRAARRFEPRTDGVWLMDDHAGTEERLSEPAVSGADTSSAHSVHTDPDQLPATPADVDARIAAPQPFCRQSFLAAGRHDTAAMIARRFPIFRYGHISSPLWRLYSVFGYEGMMVFLTLDRGLVEQATQRIMAAIREQIRMIAALGADGVWIEECLTDQISPGMFRALNLPLVQACVREIGAMGMKSVYYYCGNPNDRLQAIIDSGADALHFEESKKGFVIDVASIVSQVRGRCVVFGNLDAIGLLPKGPEANLRAEVRRQLRAGQANSNRFVMSTGSPITPATPVERVRRYADMVREEARTLHSAGS